MPAESKDYVVVFYSDLLGTRVEQEGSERTVGRIVDLIGRPGDVLLEISKLVLRQNRKSAERLLHVDELSAFSPSDVRTHADPDMLPTATIGSGEVRLGKDILDRQIVDTAGVRVYRVNDISLMRTEGKIFLAHVDVGFRGLLRRLAFDRPVVWFTRWALGKELPNRLIGWRFVQTLPDAIPHRPKVLKLTLPFRRLKNLHPVDLASLLEELDGNERDIFFHLLDQETAAEVLEVSDPEVQRDIITGLDPERAADVLESMSPAEATDILGDLPDGEATELLQEMEPEVAKDVRELLKHDKKEAGGLMTTDYPFFGPDTTAAEVIVQLQAIAKECDVIYYFYVVEDGCLMGVANMRQVLRSNPGEKLRDIMVKRLVTVKPDEDKDHIARQFGRYGLRAIPVVDDENRILGVIRFRDLLEVVAPDLT